MSGWGGCPKWHNPDELVPSRLCDLIKDEVLNFAGSNDYADLAALDHQITENLITVHSAVSLMWLPESAEQFISLCENVHRFIFQGLPRLAGKLRTEPVSFGGGLYARTRRSGSSPEHIRDDLALVFDEYREARRGQPVERVIAIFLQRFFEVHPFADGNGRTARLFCDVVARSYDKAWRWEPDFEREYTAALELAHAGRARDSSHAEDSFDVDRLECLGRLERLISRALVSIEEPQDEEPEFGR